jgi:hypothetical protein
MSKFTLAVHDACIPVHAISQTPLSPPQQGVDNKLVARYPATQVHSYLQTSLVDLHLYAVLILDMLYNRNQPFYFYVLHFKSHYPILKTK